MHLQVLKGRLATGDRFLEALFFRESGSRIGGDRRELIRVKWPNSLDFDLEFLLLALIYLASVGKLPHRHWDC